MALPSCGNPSCPICSPSYSYGLSKTISPAKIATQLPPPSYYYTYALGAKDFMLADPPKLKLETVKSTQELIGYRFWKVEKGRLKSMVQDQDWPSKSPLERVCKTECKNRRKYDWNTLTNSLIGCRWPEDSFCGIYAYKTTEDLLEDANRSRWLNEENLPRLLIGTVKLWGTVLECTGGYKAQYAEPLALYSIGDFDPLEIMEIEENHAPVYPIEYFDSGLKDKIIRKVGELDKVVLRRRIWRIRDTGKL